MDPAVKEYIAARFVPVWIDDREKERFASTTLKLGEKGYPNIALYDAAGRYCGRVVGFGGLEPWFKGLKDSVDRGGRIADLRAKAAEDPAANADLAPLLGEVPDLEKEALERYAAVPEAARTPAVVAAELKLRGRLAWLHTSRTINEEFQSLLEGVDRKNQEAFLKAQKDAYRKLASKVEKEVDDFIAKFPTADQAADALLTKANVLIQSDAFKEGIAVYESFLAKFESHPARARAEKMLAAAREKLAALAGEGKKEEPAPEGGGGK